MKIHPIWQKYPDLQKELTQVVHLMEESIQLKNKELEVGILNMIHAGGKLLRPAYQLLFSRFGQEENQKKRLALAAAVELLHTATLIHDDIVDEATIRRGVVTMNNQFDNQSAVYAGDYLFVTCFKLLSEYASTMRSLQLNARSFEKILNGELGQMNQRYQYEVTVAEYIENVSGKTAELFALSCSVGAYESGASDRFANQCREIGLNLGIAFQIVDDVLDYTQSSSHLGKPVLKDVQQGVYSLPLIYALKAEEQILPYLMKKEEITHTELLELSDLVKKSGGIEAARELAEQYTQKALKGIENLKTDQHQTKQQLYEITEMILKRSV